MNRNRIAALVAAIAAALGALVAAAPAATADSPWRDPGPHTVATAAASDPIPDDSPWGPK